VQAAAHPRLGGGELEEEEDDEQNLEEMPTIADIQDERPQEVKILEEFKKSGRWKTFLGRSAGGPGLKRGQGPVGVQEVRQMERPRSWRSQDLEGGHGSG
jgi:hypothetical protein